MSDRQTLPLPPIPGFAWPVFRPGWVWMVGAGPGDPGLLTLHAIHALGAADAVVHDALIDPRVLGLVRPGAELVAMGKRGGRESPRQGEISAELVRLARAGRRVVRLKGGDPFVFGRGGEEAGDLAAAGVPVRYVPGISSGVGGLGAAAIPLTHRDHTRVAALVTAHGIGPGEGEDGGIDWEALARACPVIVLYMAMSSLAAVTARLVAAGRAPGEPVAVAADLTLPSERVLATTLGHAAEEAAAAGIGAPAIVCVGTVAELRDSLTRAARAAG